MLTLNKVAFGRHGPAQVLEVLEATFQDDLALQVPELGHAYKHLARRPRSRFLPRLRIGFRLVQSEKDVLLDDVVAATAVTIVVVRHVIALCVVLLCLKTVFGDGFRFDNGLLWFFRDDLLVLLVTFLAIRDRRLGRGCSRLSLFRIEIYFKNS